jgi:hypothetical protein
MKILTPEEQKHRPITSGAPRPVLRKCFICLEMKFSPDKEPPFRCESCFAAIAANEADGEL